jgi:hypothetical protein
MLSECEAENLLNELADRQKCLRYVPQIVVDFRSGSGITSSN